MQGHEGTAISGTSFGFQFVTISLLEERYGDFRSKVLGMTEEDRIRQNKLDIQGYMKYILEKGAIQEKRELMQSFTSKLVLINKRIILE